MLQYFLMYSTDFHRNHIIVNTADDELDFNFQTPTSKQKSYDVRGTVTAKFV